MLIYIRADASHLIGSGHIMRCLTLAYMLKKEGHKVIFICRDLPGNFSDLITQRGYLCRLLKFSKEQKKHYLSLPCQDNYPAWLGVSEAVDVKETLAVLGSDKIDWLIVDHYGISIDWEKKLRAVARKIFVFDENLQPHDADILLNQNIFADKSDYKGLVPAQCQLLCGVAYAQIRKEFVVARAKHKFNDLGSSGKISILLTLGGADVHNTTSKIIQALDGWGNIKNFLVTVVAGAANEHLDQLQQLSISRPHINIIKQTNNMAVLMAEADIAICAGGTTSIELLYMQVPSITVILADNQEKICRKLEALNIFPCLGWYNEHWQDKLIQYLNDLITYYLDRRDKLIDTQVAVKSVSRIILGETYV